MVFRGIGTQRNSDAKRWPDLLREAQRDIAERLAHAVAGGGFAPQAYADWLMGEAAIAVLCAEAMDALAGWHGSEPGLRATAQDWGAELRELAWLAAADMRTADTRTAGGAAAAPPPLLEEWRVFLAGASGSQRAGEALGAIALHVRLLPGEADGALAALLAMPFARGTSQYLARRRRPESVAARTARDRLLDAYASAALAAGAQRAAAWHRAAIAIAQTQSRG